LPSLLLMVGRRSRSVTNLNGCPQALAQALAQASVDSS
jgi:hypothetical protein